MEVARQVAYWKDGSEEDWETVLRMHERGTDFHWTLFIAHLSVEKAMKALVARVTETVPPKTHNLLRLAELSGLTLTQPQIDLCDMLFRFCLVSRYPEDQSAFKKSINQEYVDRYVEQARVFRQWVLQRL